MTYMTSRSRFEAFQVCPRKRFWGHDYAGVGLEPARLSLPLAVGSAVHLGVQILMQRQIGELAKEWVGHEQIGIDEAVGIALDEFNEAFTSHQVDATANESMIFIHDEQAALIEILLRLWAGHPDGLPWLLAGYEVLEVEKWDLLPLVDGEQCGCNGYLHDCPTCGGKDGGLVGGITLRSRADALLRRRSDGGLYVWSLKTANQYDRRKREDQRHDVQGISEMLAVEHRLSQELQESAQAKGWDGAVPNALQRVDGTQMTYMIKGRRDLNEELNVYQLKSWLVHPWFIEAGLLGEKQYAHTYWYSCDQPHDTGRRLKNGSAVMCEGSKKHNIGTSWTQCNIWEHMTAAEWVRLVLSGDVQPSLPMPSPFVNPEPLFRNSEECLDWVDQARAQEIRVVDGLELLQHAQQNPDDEVIAPVRQVLNQFFPQHRRSCVWPSPCNFMEVCWGPPAIAEDPVGSGLFRLRTPVDHEGPMGAETVED